MIAVQKWWNHLIIRPKARVHIALLSMHATGIRKNGGVGFSLSSPSGRLSIETSRTFRFVDKRQFGFTKNEICRIREAVECIREKCRLKRNINVVLSGELGTHVGMGSGTSVRLGVLEGLFALNDVAMPKQKLVELSRRGGTSGIGINVYFSGGLIMDLGIANDSRGFAPSANLFPTRLPTSLPALSIPEWPMCLCIPKSIPPLTQEQETDFFSRVAPIESSASFEAVYHALFGVYGAVVDNDYQMFCKSIDNIQNTKWKKSEWLVYGDGLDNLRLMLHRSGVDCVGLSSLGPMVYCFAGKDIIEKIFRDRKQLDCDVIKTMPSNIGRTLQRD